MAYDLNYFIQKAESQAAEARAANLQRYNQMMGIYDEVIGRYQPGGGFMAGAEAGIEQQKTRDVSSEIAQTVSSGLFGTTVPSTAAKRWEMDVGAPQRLKLEDIRTQALSQAQIGKAGAIERREDVYPDYSMIAQMLMQASAQPTAPTGLDAFGRPLDGGEPSYTQPSYAAPSAQPSYYGGYSAPSYASYLAPTAKKAAAVPTAKKAAAVPAATPEMYGAAKAAQQWLAEPIGYQEGGGGYYGGYEEPTTYSDYLKKFSKAVSLPGYGTTAGQWEL